jgi:uncharacterized protein (DUF2225 family)
MAKRNAFLQKEVTCPACKKTSTFKYPNPRLYVAADKERDMRVINYRWAEGVSTNIKPHYFAVWQCPSCMFADFTDLFTNPQNQMGTNLLPERFNKIGMQEKLILATLRKMVPDEQEKIDLDGALAKHLAAIYIAYLVDKPDRNHNNLGRLTLRTAWLYREKHGEIETVSVESIPLKKLNDRLSDIDTQMLTIKELIDEMSLASEERAHELGLEEDSREEDSDTANPYNSIIESMRDKLQDLYTVSNMLERLVISDSQGDISLDNTKAEKVESSGALMKLKEKWTTLPVNESQALRMAISAFDYSYNHENYYQSIEQSMSVVGLIVELYTRMGNLEEALSYVAEIYKAGMGSKQGLESRIVKARKNNTLSNHDERMLKRKIGNINVSIKQAGETRRNLIKLIIDKNKELIEKTLKECGDAPSEQKIKALVNAGIPDSVVNELKSRNMIKEDKKKGLFNF